jgi:hypothetical protein
MELTVNVIAYNAIEFESSLSNQQDAVGQMTKKGQFKFNSNEDGQCHDYMF